MNYSHPQNPSHSSSVPSHSFAPQEWYSTPNFDAPLQEPVPFEEFPFTFELGPDFAMPVPLDMVPMTNDAPMIDESQFQHVEPPAMNSTVLNEDDQREFSQFLDTFFMDQDMEPLPSHMPTLYDYSQPPPPVPMDDDEEQRRSSILKSLDEQKRQHQRLLQQPPADGFRHDAVYLKKSETISFPRQPVTTTTTTAAAMYKRPSSEEHDEGKIKKRTTTERTRNRPQKELLTEAEKRANHIASEQKRRTTIRTGFKDLTDIVPTLKNINNSKSTVLFKAVEYIRYLEKRTKSLREKVNTLEMRLQVEGRKEVVMHDSAEQPAKDVAASAADALEKHKEHLKSLMQFQEQLHFQQKLMAQHEFSSPPRPRAFRPVHEESDARMLNYAAGPSASSSRPDTTATTTASTKATVSA